MPHTTEQFKAAVEEEIMKTQMSCGCADTKCDILQDDLREFAHRIISLTADMFVGEGRQVGRHDAGSVQLHKYGYNERCVEERALAEEIKSLK
jgi:hypothetical protein